MVEKRERERGVPPREVSCGSGKGLTKIASPPLLGLVAGRDKLRGTTRCSRQEEEERGRGVCVCGD